MTKMTKRGLQAALDSLVAANNRARAARDKIMAHCEEVYGVTPGDVDNDRFLDAVDGACGESAGMTADEFDESMRAAMDMAGMELPSTSKTA